MEILKRYAEFLSDDRILLMLYNTEPEKIKILKESLTSPDNYKYGEKSFKNIDLLIQRIFDYFSVVPEEFEDLKELKEEIRHFKNIKVYLKDISEIQKKIEKVKNYPSQVKELQEQYGKISPQEYTERAKVFVDPKGTEHTSAYRKIDGYAQLFEENGKEKVFNYNGFKVRIKLLLRPEDVSKAPAEYRQYWFDNVEKMVKVVK